MKYRLGRVCFIAGLFSVACGGAANTPVEEPSALDTSTQQGKAEELPPLTAVEAPEGVFMKARISNPDKGLAIAEKWGILPAEWRQIISAELPAGGFEVIDTASSVDVAMALTGGGYSPGFVGAISVGLKSLDQAVELAKASGMEIRRVAPGVYAGPDCYVARSLGESPARLVCGDEESMDYMLPYMTRGFVNEPLTQDDVWLEVKAEPILKIYGRDLDNGKNFAVPFIMQELSSIGDAAFTRAVNDALVTVVDEGVLFVKGLDGLKVVVNIDEPAERFKTGFEMSFVNDKSWVAKRSAYLGKAPISAPAAFWELPAGVTNASYSVGGEPGVFEPIRDSITEIISTLLAARGLPQASRTQVVNFLKQMWVTEKASVYGGAQTSRDAKLEPDAAEFEREVFKAAFGWHLVGVEEDSKRVLAQLDLAARVSADRNLRKLLEKEIDEKGVRAVSPITRRTPRAAGFPRGSVVYELRLDGSFFTSSSFTEDGAAKQPAPQPLSLLVAVAADGPMTWIAYGTDEALLGKQLKVAVDGGDTGTLASRAGLERLRSEKAAAGGFITASHILAPELLKVTLGGLGLGEQETGRLEQALKGKLDIPIVHFIRGESGARPKVRWEAEIPKAILQDSWSLVPMILERERSMVFGAEGETAPVVPPEHSGN